MKSVKGIKGRNLCFNFSKGKRILVYIRKDPMRETSIDMDDTTYKKSVKTAKAAKATPIVVKQPTQPKQTVLSPKKCPDGKVLNPATGRCILIKNAAKAGIAMKAAKASAKDKGKADIKKSPKKCPDGKVLNPATGRCILSKNLKK
jgi:hypothetical protein